MSEKTSSVLDSEPTRTHLIDAIKAGETNASLAKAYATSEKSIRRFRKRHGVNPAAVADGGAFTEFKADGTAEGGTAPSLVLDDPDTMLRKRGLDPEKWIIANLRANEYQGPASSEHTEATGETKVTYNQTRFNVVPKEPIVPAYQIVAPRTDGPSYKPRARRSVKAPTLIAVLGDQQAPFHDKGLHARFLEWTAQNQPEEIVNLGDSLDLPNISRHQLDPENSASVNESLQSGYDMYRDYREAAPDARMRKLYGNHDERLRNLILDIPKNNALHGLKRPDTATSTGESVFELSHLMRLDELAIELSLPHGSYQLGQILLSDKLAVRHGWLAKQGAGSTALASLRQLGYSVIVGHTHRQSIVHETKHEITGNVRVLKGVEAGCMCRVDQTPDPVDGRIWPNYTPAPDWQQGFCTVALHPSGYFQIDLASYVNGTLLWRDQIYTP